jgi:RNA polymerase sigma-70 factor (ECF subfamily)
MDSSLHSGTDGSGELLSDESLALSVQKGDTDAFGELVTRYEKKLARYGTKFLSNPEDITDLVQDVFLKAYQNMKSFDTSLKFSPWIYRIAHNEFVTALRKRSRRPLIHVDFDTFISHPVYDDPSEREREQKEIRAVLEKGIEELPDKYREVLILFYLEELSYQEVAEVLHVPVATVGIRLKRAREKLKSIYTENPAYHGTLT